MMISILAGLNPCFVGRWTSTSQNKTILIINKLKNFTKEIFTSLNKKLTISKRVQRYDFFLSYASQLILKNSTIFALILTVHNTTMGKKQFLPPLPHTIR